MEGRRRRYGDNLLKNDCTTSPSSGIISIYFRSDLHKRFLARTFDFEIPFDIETDCSNTVRVFNLDIYNQSVILAFTFVWITKPFLVFTAQSAFNAVIFANCTYCVVAGDAADTSIT